VVGAELRQIIRSHRRNPFLKSIAEGCEKFLRAWYNEGFWEHQRNGEAFVLREIAAWAGNRPLIVWDVGAHDGGWARTACAGLPSAEIHSFELVPAIAERLEALAAGNPRHHVHRTGLSDKAGEVEVVRVMGQETRSFVRPVSATGANPESLENVGAGFRASIERAQISTIDEMAGRLPPPDFLKIDTEGHEAAVFRGGRSLFAGPNAPAIVQFEYGKTYVRFHALLADVCAILEPAGYAIGRLYPDHVDFQPYHMRLENFRMGNMIAVRDPELKRRLS
jgi:FkbM family methyltransferase